MKPLRYVDLTSEMCTVRKQNQRRTEKQCKNIYQDTCDREKSETAKATDVNVFLERKSREMYG